MVKTFEIIHLGKTQLCQGDTRPTKSDILLLAQFYLLRNCAEIAKKKSYILLLEQLALAMACFILTLCVDIHSKTVFVSKSSTGRRQNF